MGRWANKYVIGLTGNIATGKSLVRQMLQHLGAYTIDADSLAHQVMVPGAPAYGPVIDTFGKWILDSENKIDRGKLGAVAFAHPEALRRLEALTHPIVMGGIDALIGRAKQPIGVVEAIKLIETPLGQQVDAVWVVDSTPQVQIQRLMSKRGMSETEARRRIEVQGPQQDKLAKATVVITNNGSPEEVWAQVQREWNKILASRGVKQPTEEVRTVQVSQQAQARAAQQAAQPQQPVAQPQRSTPPAQPAQQPIAQKVATGTSPAVPAQPAPPRPASAPVRQTQSAPAAPVQPAKPVVQMQITRVDVRRALPKNADDIARLLNQASGKTLTRMDVIMAFGQKSYWLAEFDGRPIGLTGFQVDNLITRMDEMVIIPEAPVAPVAEALIGAIEEASKELESEVVFSFLPNGSSALEQTFVDQGYEKITLDTIKVPAWREAATESQPPNTQIYKKQLRERVLKPI